MFPLISICYYTSFLSKIIHQSNCSALETHKGMVFDIAENTNINSVQTTLPKNSLCLGQIKIHISSTNDNRHPYNKGLIILPLKIVVVINRHCDPTSGKTLLGPAKLLRWLQWCQFMKRAGMTSNSQKGIQLILYINRCIKCWDHFEQR